MKDVESIISGVIVQRKIWRDGSLANHQKARVEAWKQIKIMGISMDYPIRRKGVGRKNMIIKQGLKKYPDYAAWRNMIYRCENSKCKDFKYYGARGIKVCKRWHDLRNFVKDMGLRPNGLTLERINNNGNYEPSNCKWASRAEQHQNTRAFKKSHYLKFWDSNKTLREMAILLNTSSSNIWNFSNRNKLKFKYVRRSTQYPRRKE